MATTRVDIALAQTAKSLVAKKRFERESARLVDKLWLLTDDELEEYAVEVVSITDHINSHYERHGDTIFTIKPTKLVGVSLASLPAIEAEVMDEIEMEIENLRENFQVIDLVAGD